MQTTKEKFDLGSLSTKNDNNVKQFRRPQTYTKDEIRANKRSSNREIIISDSKVLKNSRNRPMTESDHIAVDSLADQSPRAMGRFPQNTLNAAPTVINDYARKNQQLYNRRKEIQSKYNSLQTNMVIKKTAKPKAMKPEQPQTPLPHPSKYRNSKNSEMLENAIQVLFTMTPKSKRSKRSKIVAEKNDDLSDECSEFKNEPIVEKNAMKNVTQNRPTTTKVNTRWTFDEPISLSENAADCYKKLIEIKEVVQKHVIPPRSKVNTRWSFDVPSMTKSTTKCYNHLLDIEDAAKKLERLQTEVKLHIASQPVKVSTSTSITNFPRYFMIVFQANQAMLF